jgi:hypothetical protein
MIVFFRFSYINFFAGLAAASPFRDRKSQQNRDNICAISVVYTPQRGQC